MAGLFAVLLVAAAVAWFLFGGQFREWWQRPAPPEPSGKELRVHVLDVGQADSILVVAPSGKTVLVDAGEPGDGKRILEATSTGAFIDGNAPSNIPPKLPISESVRALKVPRASRLISSTAAFARSMETPASEYVIGSVIALFRRRPAVSRCRSA